MCFNIVLTSGIPFKLSNNSPGWNLEEKKLFCTYICLPSNIWVIIVYLPGLVSCSAVTAKISDATKKPKEITVHPEEEMSGNTTLKSYPVCALDLSRAWRVKDSQLPSTVWLSANLSATAWETKPLYCQEIWPFIVWISLGPRCYSLSAWSPYCLSVIKTRNGKQHWLL